MKKLILFALLSLNSIFGIIPSVVSTEDFELFRYINRADYIFSGRVTGTITEIIDSTANYIPVGDAFAEVSVAKVFKKTGEALSESGKAMVRFPRSTDEGFLYELVVTGSAQYFRTNNRGVWFAKRIPGTNVLEPVSDNSFLPAKYAKVIDAYFADPVTLKEVSKLINDNDSKIRKTVLKLVTAAGTAPPEPDSGTVASLSGKLSEGSIIQIDSIHYALDLIRRTPGKAYCGTLDSVLKKSGDYRAECMAMEIIAEKVCSENLPLLKNFVGASSSSESAELDYSIQAVRSIGLIGGRKDVPYLKEELEKTEKMPVTKEVDVSGEKLRAVNLKRYMLRRELIRAIFELSGKKAESLFTEDMIEEWKAEK
ncbi:MAG: hypothetical protein ACLFQK_00490 [Fibrobacterota bacterium]